MIGQLLAIACSDRAVLARLGGPLGEAAREAAGELVELPAAEQRAVRARIAAAARLPIPPGIRGAHASWIEAGLVGLPARARAALAGGAREPAEVWLVRWACAELPPLPAVDPALPAAGSLDNALRMSGDALARWLAEVGADQLAHALHAADARALVAVANVVGDRLIAAARRIDAEPRAGQLGPRRAAIVRCRGVEPGVRGPSDGDAATVIARPQELAPTQGIAPDHLLVRIGARALAGHADALARAQLAVRLPRPLGLVVRDELVAHAATPVDQCPTWLALGAAWY